MLGAAPVRAGRVDHQDRGIAEDLARVVEDIHDTRRGRHVAHDAVHGAAVDANLVCRRGDDVGLPADDDYPGALGGERLGCAAPASTAATGDDRDLAGDAEIHPVS